MWKREHMLMELIKDIQAGTTDRRDGTTSVDRLGQGVGVSFFVIGRSCLAAQYLMVLLRREPKIRPITFDQVDVRIASASCPVFIFDNSCLLIPLGECLRRLQHVHPAGRYIVIDSNRTEEDIAQMLSLGVQGFVEQEKVAMTLRDAVLTVVEGRLWAPLEALQTYVKSTAARARSGTYELDNPTPRESQVLELVKERFTNKEISQMLGVQESTIKFHLSNIYSKLQVDSRLQLTPDKQPPFFWSEA
jgi:DNA-binding NarL/FixJ family response regulator